VVVLEEVLKHVANCCRTAWRYSLSIAPCIDPLDQLRLDPDAVFRFMPAMWRALGCAA